MSTYRELNPNPPKSHLGTLPLSYSSTFLPIILSYESWRILLHSRLRSHPGWRAYSVWLGVDSRYFHPFYFVFFLPSSDSVWPGHDNSVAGCCTRRSSWSNSQIQLPWAWKMVFPTPGSVLIDYVQHNRCESQCSHLAGARESLADVRKTDKMDC